MPRRPYGIWTRPHPRATWTLEAWFDGNLQDALASALATIAQEHTLGRRSTQGAIMARTDYDRGRKPRAHKFTLDKGATPCPPSPRPSARRISPPHPKPAAAPPVPAWNFGGPRQDDLPLLQLCEQPGPSPATSTPPTSSQQPQQ
jgi:hypothetical protein